MREAVAARGPQPNPTGVRPMRRPLFRSMRNDHEAGGSDAPPQARLTPPQLAAKKPKNTDVRQELDTRIRVLEAAIKPDLDASVKRDRRPSKERELEASTTPSVEETGETGRKKPRIDDDSAEEGPAGAFRWSQ